MRRSRELRRTNIQNDERTLANDDDLTGFGKGDRHGEARPESGSTWLEIIKQSLALKLQGKPLTRVLNNSGDDKSDYRRSFD